MDKRFLIYYTHGYSNGYLPIMKLSINSLREYNQNINYDIVILSDEQYVNDCEQIENVIVIPMKNSKSPEEASMHKLNIFNYDKINEYDVVFFIDSDILVHSNILQIVDNCTKKNCLYVYSENADIESHKHIYFGLENYSNEQIEYFQKNNIHVFNAGCFAFKPSEEIKEHFNNVNDLIKNNTRKFFYEQSFMNVYFNTYSYFNNDVVITDRNVLTNKNYIMFPNLNNLYLNALIHFCGGVGDPNYKYPRMLEYIANLHKYKKNNNLY